MIPYLAPPTIALGPLRIHAFGMLVATAVLIGMVIGGRRFRQHGLDGAVGESLAWWVVLGGFLGAHLFAVVFYFPDKIIEDPLLLLRFWEDISSFGGILGGAIGMSLFFRLRASALPPVTKWAYVDVVAFVFPISLMIGRLGCALAHDHPGSVTDFPLAISLRNPEAQAFIYGVYAGAGALSEFPPREALAHLGFHDMGWYEFLYLALVVVPGVVLVGRTARRPGSILGVFILLYMPVRFLLDFLRITDARYGGLTPAQWVALGALFGLAVVATRLRSPSRVGRSNTPASPSQATISSDASH